MVRSNRMRREWMNAPRHTYNHSTTQAASQQTFTRKLPQRAPGWGESSSSSEVGRKPIGQIRLCHFLTELSINLQHCAVIRSDLGLSQHSVWECSERLLIRPGAYDDITQPLSLYTRPTVSLYVCLPICLFHSLPLSSRMRRWLYSSNGRLLNLTSGCNPCPLIQFYAERLPSQCWPNTENVCPFVSNLTYFTHSTQQVHQQVSSASRPASILRQHMHKEPSLKRYTLILNPGLLQALCEWWDCAEMEINEPSLQPW